jgi:hypothetical protein
MVARHARAYICGGTSHSVPDQGDPVSWFWMRPREQSMSTIATPTTPSNEASVHGSVPHLLAWTHRSTAKAELRRQVLGDHQGVAPSEP